MQITITNIDKEKTKQARDILKSKGLNFQAINKIILEKAYDDIIDNNYNYIIKKMLEV